MFAVIVSIAVFSCAGVPSPVPVAAPAEAPATAMDLDQLTMREARHNVDVLVDRLAEADPRTRLRTPESLDDVLQILRSDRLDLFEAGVAFAHAATGKEARALEAQLEFAWAEAMQGTASLYGEVAASLADEDLSRDYTRVAQSLGRLADEHLETGVIVTTRLLLQAPDDYVGYRVALDFHRMAADWDRFDATVAAVENLNPDSVGLMFQKGAAAWTRHDDAETALTFLNEALTADPEFTRVQAYVIEVEADEQARCGAFVRLSAMSPHHQLVQLLEGDFAQICYEGEEEEEAEEG